MRSVELGREPSLLDEWSFIVRDEKSSLVRLESDKVRGNKMWQVEMRLRFSSNL